MTTKRTNGNQPPRIALFGPVAPLRGGVAQYTTQLHRSLGRQANVETVSFKRMYPGWLYPGESEVEPGSEPLLEPGVWYELDVYNPLTWRRAADRIVQNGCDLAVLDWWTLFWQPGFAYMARRLRKGGIKTVYLCHNLADHQTGGSLGLAGRVMSRASRRMLAAADAYIVQSKEQADLLCKLKPAAHIVTRMHPIYTHFPEPNKHLPKRGRLELLFFGFIRPYKGLEVLLDALSIRNDHDIYVTVAGEPWGRAADIKKKLTDYRAPNLELHLKYIDNATTANYFARADVVALPYRSATGSGVVALAYNYGKPVLASNVGGLQDAVIDGQTGWLVPPESPPALAGKIAQITRKQAQSMAPAIKQFCKANSWDELASDICNLAK